MDVFAETITDEDVINFVGISGDSNPLHVSHEFASETIFKGRIAHGILTASFISTVIGTKMPGPGCIYVSQNLRFKAPVRAGNTITATCVVPKLMPKKFFIELSTVCLTGGKPVVKVHTTIMVPSRTD